MIHQEQIRQLETDLADLAGRAQSAGAEYVRCSNVIGTSTELEAVAAAISLPNTIFHTLSVTKMSVGLLRSQLQWQRAAPAFTGGEGPIGFRAASEDTRHIAYLG
jgi:hypothetical protein